MVNVTMDQIIAFRNNEDIFADASLPLKVAYKLNKLKKAVAVEGEFYTNKFQEIVDKYARKDENGDYEYSEDRNQILIKEGMVDECNQALIDLQTLTVEVDNCNLTFEDFGDAVDSIECTPEQLEALMPFLN